MAVAASIWPTSSASSATGYAELAGWQDVERESPLSITLVQALQAGDKMDFTIQKAVELGVRDFVLVESRRSVLRLAGERCQARRALAGRGGFGLRTVRAQSGAAGGAGRRLETGWPGRLPGTLRLMLAPDAEMSFASIRRRAGVQLLIGAEGGSIRRR